MSRVCWDSETPLTSQDFLSLYIPIPYYVLGRSLLRNPTFGSATFCRTKVIRGWQCEQILPFGFAERCGYLKIWWGDISPGYLLLYRLYLRWSWPSLTRVINIPELNILVNLVWCQINMSRDGELFWDCWGGVFVDGFILKRKSSSVDRKYTICHFLCNLASCVSVSGADSGNKLNAGWVSGRRLRRRPDTQPAARVHVHD